MFKKYQNISPEFMELYLWYFKNKTQKRDLLTDFKLAFPMMTIVFHYLAYIKILNWCDKSLLVWYTLFKTILILTSVSMKSGRYYLSTIVHLHFGEEFTHKVLNPFFHCITASILH